jgi:hypothetical protein
MFAVLAAFAVGILVGLHIMGDASRERVAGKRGGKVRKFMASLRGSRSAWMLLVFVSEALARQFGYETGPVLGVLHSLLSAIGWDPAEVTRDIGVDPEVIAGSVVAIYVAVVRLLTWWRDRRSASTPVAA